MVAVSNEEREGMDYRMRRWVAIGGLAFIVVIIVSIFATPSTPNSTASAAKVATFVDHHRNGLYLSAYLTSLSVLVGVSFLWYLREVVAPSVVGRRMANLGFAGGLLFAVSGIYGAGSSFAMADVAKHADSSVLQTLNIFSEDVNDFGGAAFALLIGATSLGILQSRALPRWLAYVGMVLAVATFALPFVGFIGVALWVLITSIVLFAQAKKSGRSPVAAGEGAGHLSSANPLG